MLHLNLKSFWQSIEKDKYLLLALLLGLLLRGLNPTFGSPSLYISNDEAIAHLAALNMIVAKTPVSISNYTPLGAYVQIPFLVGGFLAMQVLGLVSGLRGFEIFLLTHEGYFLFIPRLISAFFGTFLILIVYKLTKELFKSKTTATIAAFLTAVSFNLVHISHFGRPWSAAMFFFLLAIYFAIKNKVLLAYLTIAVSFGFHQAGILGLPLVVWLCTKRFKYEGLFGFIVMLFLIITFNNLTLKTGLVDAISRDQSFLKSGKFAADFISGKPDLVSSFIRSIKDNLASYFIVNFIVTDGIILIFSIVGIASAFKIKGAASKIVIYCSLYFICASLFFHPLIRYLLPVAVLLIPFAALGIVRLFDKKKQLIFVILVVAAVNSIWWNYLFLKTPTFILAHDWIDKNISVNTPVGFVGGRLQTFAPDKDSILATQTINKSYSKTLFALLDDRKPSNVRNILYTSNFPGKDKLTQFHNAFKKFPFVYVVDYYIDPHDRLYSIAPDEFESLKLFNPAMSGGIVPIPEPLFDSSWNFPINDSRQKVSMYSLNNAGPYVEILKIKSY